MKRILALTLALLMLIPMFLACGGENEKQDQSNPPASDDQNSDDSTNSTPPDGSQNDGSESDKTDSDTGSNEDVNPEAQLRFSLSSLNLSVGESRTMNTVYTPMYASDTYKLIYASSDESIVTIDENGEVKALKPGTVKITVTTESKNQSAECDITVLATSNTLKGSIHVPPIDSQGNLGTCAHESVTYTQFTIAVSQYINHHKPSMGWNPSSGELRYIFSPKYTFNFAGAGTEYAYNIIKDHGCLTEDLSRFYHSGDASLSGPSNAPYKETASWDVSEGLMEIALRYRLKNFEEIDYSGAHSGNLTVGGTHNMDLFNRVKAAIRDGNAVVICGWSSYWNYAVTSKPGTLGAAGENCIYSSSNPNNGMGDGNHAVTIVGYDDEIEAQIGGITMKGAFQVMNSWGTGYSNDGYVWMMYDAFNEDSEFPILNRPNNENTDIFSPSDNMKFLRLFSTTKPFTFDFTAVGSVELDGKTYTTYTIYEPASKKYLGYNTTGIKMIPNPLSSTFNEWALVPYLDVHPDAKDKEFYKDAVLLYAFKRPKGTTLSAANCFSATTYYNTPTCQFNSAVENGGLCAMTLLGMPSVNATNFSSAIQFTNSMSIGNNKAERTSTIYRFSFIDWRTDIEINKYGLRIEAEVSTTTRENFKIDLLRVDASGNLAIHRPWLFEYGSQGMHNEYMQNEKGEELKNVISFSGVPHPTKAESGYFTLTYDTMGTIPKESTYENFLWGIRINGHTSNIKSLKLIAPNGKVLSEIKLDEQYNMLKWDEAARKKETKDYFFDLGKTVHTFASDGQFFMKNVGTNSYLGNRATLFYETTKDAGMDMLLNFKTDPNTGKFILYDDEMNMVLDIFQKEIKEGVMVKFNASSANRANTQDWTLVYNDDGTVSFRLTQYPDYYFGYDPNSTANSKFVLRTDKDSDYCKWILEGAGEENVEIPTIQFNNGNATYSATKPKDSKASAVTLRVFDKTGAVVSETSLTFAADNTVKTTVSGLKSGETYVFVLNDGTYDVGVNYIVKCQ